MNTPSPDSGNLSIRRTGTPKPSVPPAIRVAAVLMLMASLPALYACKIALVATVFAFAYFAGGSGLPSLVLMLFCLLITLSLLCAPCLLPLAACAEKNGA